MFLWKAINGYNILFAEANTNDNHSGGIGIWQRK